MVPTAAFSPAMARRGPQPGAGCLPSSRSSCSSTPTSRSPRIGGQLACFTTTRPAPLRPARVLGSSRPRPRREDGLRCSAGYSLMPGGQKQAKVKLPALFVETSAADVLDEEGLTLRAIDEAVAGGATGVVLRDSAGQSGGAELYDAACRVRNLLRGRAVLLVVDRTDIADAAEADGVLLSSKGVPIGVARRMLSGAGSLVGALVSSPTEAANTAEQGANLVVLQGADAGPTAGDLRSAVEQQKAGSIPVIGAVSGADEAAAATTAKALLACEASSGLSLPVPLLLCCGEAAAAGAMVSSTQDAASVLMASMRAANTATAPSEKPLDAEASEAEAVAASGKASGMGSLLNQEREDLVAEEKQLLQDILALLKEVSPDIQEIDLLEDALVGLDELFLLVVVGEFNSGKSSFINALLGERFLAEGILPTTNEISVLRHGDGPERVEQDADGMYQRYLPAELLKEINIVDTPGTNVVLERQQRLTEEYIPRADLVLFVMSADRPFTESEVKFLKYIRQWGKKVVFILNKADLLLQAEQVEQVRSFVSNNVLDLLGVDSPVVLPLSSRNALQAKLDAGSAAAGGLLSSMDDQQLATSPAWATSGFSELESFLLSFLVGDPGKASESVRLKLETPLSVADALLGVSRQQLKGDLASAEKDLEALLMVEQQLASFRAEMERDSAVQQERIQKLVRSAAAKTEALIDRELQLSSGNLTSYLFAGGSGPRPQDMPVAAGFRAEIGGVASEVQKLVQEHSRFANSNAKRQLDNYRSFAASQAQALGVDLDLGAENGDRLPTRAAVPGDAGASEEAAANTAPAATLGNKQSAALVVALPAGALSVVEELELGSVGLLLNEEVRESYTVTGGAVAGAGVFGVITTALLPTTWEDLLACAVAGLIGYLAVLNLPLRRAETKGKVKRVATNFSAELSSAMEGELAAAMDSSAGAIMAWINPLVEAARREVAMVQEAEQRRAQLAARLEETREKASNVS